MADERFMVGDVIQIHRGPGVSRDLEDKWFRVEAIEPDGSVRLSLPYLDQALTQRYHATRPPRRLT